MRKVALEDRAACMAADCDGRAFIKGLCRKHHKRLWRHGDWNVTLTPGFTAHPLYRTWESLLWRVRNEDNPNYGGRGITVCDRWSTGENGIHPFLCFAEDMGQKPSPAHSIERRDNDGDYTPENCVWATRTTQSNNRRSNHRIVFDGHTMTLSQWCRLLGVPRRQVSQRIRRGWGFVEAVTTSTGEARRVATETINGRTMEPTKRALTEGQDNGNSNTGTDRPNHAENGTTANG